MGKPSTGTVPPLPTNSIPTTDQFTNVTWAELVLTFLGAPVSQNNVDNLTSWMPWENATSTWTGTAGANNPLNNGLGSGGGSGLGSYPDLIISAYYAAQGLQGGIQNAAPIGAALKADAPFSVFHAATVNSNWSGDHYSGSGWLGVTSASIPTAVTAADSAKNGATGTVATSSPQTQAILQQALSAEAQNVFNSGSFWSNVGNSINTLTGGVPKDVANAVKDVASWTDSLGGILGDISSADWWKRVGLFAAGVVLIIGGVVLFISTTKTGQRAESTAIEGAEMGALA